MQGVNYPGIEKQTGVNARTAGKIVHWALERAGKHATLKTLLKKANVDSKPKSGRPEAVSERDKRYFIRTAERPENRRSTLVELVETAGLNISHETARKYLDQAGLHWRKPWRKPILTKIQKRRRLAWCRAHKNTDWSKWIFTDETSIIPGQARGRDGVWRRVGEEYQGDKGTVNRKKKDKGSVMFWGAICLGIPGPSHVWVPETAKEKNDATALLKLDNDIREVRAVQAALLAPPPPKKRGPKLKRLTEEKKRKSGLRGIDWYRYQKNILKPCLYPFYHQVKAQRGQVVLMEDGAGPHSHHLLTEERDLAGVVQEEWPSSSPDLNPIEIVWNQIKDNIDAHRPKATKVKDFRSLLLQEWESFSQEKIDILINSMPTRIEACIKDKGGNNFNL